MSSNNPLTAEGEIGLGRDVSQSVPGGFAAAGAINGNLRARAAATFFYGALGSITTGGTYDTFNVADDLPLWTIEKKVGSASPELLALRYRDTMVNTLNISAPAGALATFSAGVITAYEERRRAYEATPSQFITPSYAAASDDLLVFHGGRIKNGASGGSLAQDETFQSIEVAMNNNIAADEYTVRPSRFLRSLTEGIRSIETNMTLVFENPDKYSQYTYGATSNDYASYSFYMGALEIFLGNWQVVSAEDITTGSPAGAPANPQAVQISIPKLAFTGLPVALSSGRIAVTTSARALKGTGSIITAIVRPQSAGAQ